MINNFLNIKSIETQQGWPAMSVSSIAGAILADFYQTTCIPYNSPTKKMVYIFVLDINHFQRHHLFQLFIY